MQVAQALGNAKLTIAQSRQRVEPSLLPNPWLQTLLKSTLPSPHPRPSSGQQKKFDRGRVVGVPTDARYVLVADPFNLHAAGRVFAAKGRDSVRSLPLAISDILMAEDLGKELTSRFYILARHFWPGPLTIIVPAGGKVPLKVTGNTGRLAIRHAHS